MKPAPLAVIAALALLAPLAAAEDLPVQWASIAPLPIQRTDIGAATLQGRIYVVGGNEPGADDFGTRVDMYRTNINFWDTAAPLPVAVHDPAVVAVGYTILVMGGNMRLPGGLVVPTQQTWMLDTSLPESFQFWMPWLPLPEPIAHAAAATDGFTTVWLFGGDDPFTHVASAKAWRMATPQGRPSGVWQPLPDMPEARTRAAAAQFGNGEVWLAGGEDGNLRAKASADVLDLTTNTWRSAPPMAQARQDLALAASIGGLYALGGRSPTFPLDSVEMFDRDSGAWVGVAPMPQATWGAPAAAWLSDVYVVGGHDQVGNPTPNGQRLHVSTDLP